MSEMDHACFDPSETDDGWFYARCNCGFSQGPLPDVETMIDELMEHAYREGRMDGTP